MKYRLRGIDSARGGTAVDAFAVEPLATAGDAGRADRTRRRTSTSSAGEARPLVRKPCPVVPSTTSTCDW